MLIPLLKNDNALIRYFDTQCSENGVAVNVDQTINADDILIIKIDRYYNHLVDRPGPSPDCLVILKCSENTYRIFLIELRDISGPNGFTVEEIKSKFLTCLDDFMSKRFANYFHNALFEFLEIKLLFVTDPYHFSSNPGKQEKMRGHKLDALMAQRIPRYFGKYLYIEHKLPNPVIRNCRVQIQN